MARRKDFRGREERFSWKGGKIFGDRWKHFHGKEEIKSGQKLKEERFSEGVISRFH